MRRAPARWLTRLMRYVVGKSKWTKRRVGDRGSRRSVAWAWFLTALMATTLAGCAGPGVNGPRTNIGVVDPQRVLNETQKGREAKNTLNEFMKNRQELLALEEQELKRMEEDLMKQASVLSANARREREGQFRQRMLRYQQRAAELNREVQEKQQQLLMQFRSEIERLAAVVARRRNLLLVIEKGRGAPTIYSDDTIDITTDVIQEFKQGAP